MSSSGLEREESDWLPRLSATLCEPSPKEFHYFFLRPSYADDERIFDGARQCPFDIDLKTITSTGTRGVLSVHPSKGKEWIRPPWSESIVLRDVPRELLYFVTSNRKSRSRLPKSRLPKSSHPKSSLSDLELPESGLPERGLSLPTLPPSSFVHGVALDLLRLLSAQRWDDRGTWLRIAIILLNAFSRTDSVIKNAFFEHSRQSQKFDIVECEKLWHSAIRDDYDGPPLTFHSLHVMAQLDNPDGYHSFLSRHQPTLPPLNTFRSQCGSYTQPVPHDVDESGKLAWQQSFGKSGIQVCRFGSDYASLGSGDAFVSFALHEHERCSTNREVFTLSEVLRPSAPSYLYFEFATNVSLDDLLHRLGLHLFGSVADPLTLGVDCQASVNKNMQRLICYVDNCTWAMCNSIKDQFQHVNPSIQFKDPSSHVPLLHSRGLAPVPPSSLRIQDHLVQPFEDPKLYRVRVLDMPRLSTFVSNIYVPFVPNFTLSSSAPFDISTEPILVPEWQPIELDEIRRGVLSNVSIRNILKVSTFSIVREFQVSSSVYEFELNLEPRTIVTYNHRLSTLTVQSSSLFDTLQDSNVVTRRSAARVVDNSHPSITLANLHSRNKWIRWSEVYNSSTFHPFPPDQRLVVVRGGMGSGKTKELLNFLRMWLKALGPSKYAKLKKDMKMYKIRSYSELTKLVNSSDLPSADVRICRSSVDLILSLIFGCKGVPGANNDRTLDTDMVKRRAVVDTSSKSEQRFTQALESRTGLKFKMIRPLWLINPLTSHPLELDLFCEEKHVAIEYDGPQHYTFPNVYHRTREEFDAQC
ncbi:hypothetical protein CEUSTIGMA_g13287.t1 [Chlamydomonas eustigma]|uniref:Primase C-terminal 2 domain-containing protein n=1 Tax=Chlamydomonas eustigma TaxID=1157962 RepID=A0A250XS01_9CHLO|nr:hypothetical protein CEUSTIGMA_g13287.t1 [Chlamydomonas eustigma]|eukprot:GAX85871.1 hypothetical protein CEUSTIGMA_g13287.t1 [Chlamydomonas eustigma]